MSYARHATYSHFNGVLTSAGVLPPAGWVNPLILGSSCDFYRPSCRQDASDGSFRKSGVAGGDASAAYLQPSSFSALTSSTQSSESIAVPSKPGGDVSRPERIEADQNSGRDDLLNQYFQEHVLNRNSLGYVDKAELRLFCDNYPKGLILHEHLGCHQNTTLEWAIDAKLFWDTNNKCLSKEGGSDRIPAEHLQLQANDKLRAAFFETITQPKSCKDLQEANSHFHSTFVWTGMVDVPLHAKLVEEYRSAQLDKLQGSHVMIDLPNFSEPTREHHVEELLAGITKPEELTDEFLGEIVSRIRDWASGEAILWRERFIEQEALARAALELEDSIFGTDNPIILTVIAEIGKTHSNICQEGSLGDLLFRFICDTAKAVELQRCCRFVKTINCVGPEHLTVRYESFQARILQYFCQTTPDMKGIAFHIGELCTDIASPTQMTNRLQLIEQIRPKRAGHGTCIQQERELRFLQTENIPIEVCPTATKRLLRHRHPTMRFVKAGVPIVVSTDNRHVFKTTQSKEWYRTLKHWDGLTYRDVQTLARNSIEYSDLDGKSILKRDGVHFTVRSEFIKFLTMPAVEENFEFQLLDEKPKVQIRHERAMIEFENDLLLRHDSGKSLSSSPPNGSLATKRYALLHPMSR